MNHLNGLLVQIHTDGLLVCEFIIVAGTLNRNLVDRERLSKHQVLILGYFRV